MSRSPSLSAQFFGAVGEFVRGRTGLVFSEGRRSAFEAGVIKAMHRVPLTDPEVYLSRLRAEPTLLDDLVGEITVGETYFFRDPDQFAVIRDQVIPALLSHWPRERPLRIWSAGCATGEEPYTVAILLREQGLAGAAHIVATDVSRRALAAARRGRYTRWSLRGVPERTARTYFEAMGRQFELVRGVRDAVGFRYLNLAEDIYPSLPTGIWGMDLILCRNVLIYFDAATVARVARRLIDSLSDEGWLVLGASDPALGELVPCDVVVMAAGLAYRRPGRVAVTPGATRVATSDFPGLLPPEPVELMQRPPPAAPPPAEPAGGPPPGQAAADGPAEAVRSYAQRDYERAAELAARLVRSDGSAPEPWVVLVRALANRGELEAAGQWCAAALDRHRDSAELAYLHAVLLAEAGRHADAVTAARRALYLDRRLVVGHLVLGGALARLGDTAGARRAVRNAERLLADLAPDDIVPASDGEPAGRLAEMARVQLELLQGTAA